MIKTKLKNMVNKYPKNINATYTAIIKIFLDTFKVKHLPLNAALENIAKRTNLLHSNLGSTLTIPWMGNMDIRCLPTHSVRKMLENLVIK